MAIFIFFALSSSCESLAESKTGGNKMFQGHEAVEKGAWCWFADPRAVRHTSQDGKIDKTYIGCIDTQGRIKALVHDHTKNDVKEILVRDGFQADDHDNPTFLILPDDRVMIFYSRHTDEPCFYYRTTKEAGNLETLGEEKRLETLHNTTYPSPFILSSDPDHIYLCWRGINWHPTIGKLTLPDENGRVRFEGTPRQIVSSGIGGNGGIRPYAKYSSNGKDKIFIAYTATHPDNICPNPLYCSYIDISDLTLRSLDGKTLAPLDRRPFRITGSEIKPSFVVDDSSHQKRNWVWEIQLDSNENPVIAFTRISDDKQDHEYFYAKWNGIDWTKTFIAKAGGKFHKSGIEYCYSGGMALDKNDLSALFVSLPVQGRHGKVFEIHRYDLNSEGTEVIDSNPVTFNSEKNNVRPYMVQNGDSSELFWMHGDYYYWGVTNAFPQGFPTSINSLKMLPYVEKAAASTPLPSAEALKEQAKKVADYWIENNKSEDGSFEWNNAVYHTGNMALYFLTGDEKYRNYSETWAKRWKYEGYPDYEKTGMWEGNFADNHAAFQTFFDLYKIEPAEEKIKVAKYVMERQLNDKSPEADRWWWWIDAFYMAMPVYTRLGNMTGDKAYFEKMYRLFADAKYRKTSEGGKELNICPVERNGCLYDTDDHLWFRDAKYTPGNMRGTSPNGKKVYWSRGNGWVLAALARTLEELPDTEPHRAEYIQTFKEMADALVKCQGSDGFWRRNLADYEDLPQPETSGTAMFLFGLAWGVRKGLLDSKKFMPTIVKGYNGMSALAIHESGRVGRVQPIGEEPTPTQEIGYDRTHDFAVGATLLLLCELAKLQA